MDKYLSILSRLLERQKADDRPVCTPIPTDRLKEIVDVSLDNYDGSPLEELEKTLKQFLDLNPDVSQLAFHKQLYSGVNMPAVLGEWVATLSNSVMHTFKVGPVSNLMELEVIKQLCLLVGYENGEGLMVSGASQANLVSMMLARHELFPEIKKEGYAGKQLVAFVSDQSHYSMQRAANVMGLGSENLIAVKSDEHGRLCHEALREAIQESREQGKFPFYVGLTAGTTVLGAYDPIEECINIAQENGLWVHIDGAWGAPILFSQIHRSVLNSCDQADSFTWDAHKLLNVPLTAGVILTREKGKLLAATSGGGENYLFHAGTSTPVELGELSIQSARRADCVKVWSAWKAVGLSGFRNKVDHLMQMKEYFVSLFKELDCLEVIAPTPYLNILFQYRPACLMSEERISKLNKQICIELAQVGNAFIDYATFGGRTGIRLVLANSETNESYLDQLCDTIMKVGEKLSQSEEENTFTRPDPLRDPVLGQFEPLLENA